MGNGAITPPPTKTFPLQVEQGSLDFGETWSQSGYQHKLRISNISNASVQILRFYTACDCTVVTPESLVLPPKASRTVTLTLDLRNDRPLSDDTFDRHFSTKLRPLIATGSGAASELARDAWEVRGLVKDLMHGLPEIVPIGEDLDPGSLSAHSILVRTHPQINTLQLEINHDIVDANITELHGASNQFEMTIRPAANAPFGSMAVPVRVIPVLDGERTAPPMQFTVVGSVAPEVVVVPKQVHLGAIIEGETASGTIALASRDGRPFECRVWPNTQPESLIISPSSDTPGHLEFHIVANANQLGIHKNIVRLQIRLKSSKEFAVNVPVSFQVVKRQRSSRIVSQQ